VRVSGDAGAAKPLDDREAPAKRNRTREDRRRKDAVLEEIRLDADDFAEQPLRPLRLVGLHHDGTVVRKLDAGHAADA
jgi:hypothetical protein